MKRVYLIFCLILAIAFSDFLSAQANSLAKWKDEFVSDYKNFYSWNNLSKLALGIGFAGCYANTTFDQSIQDCYCDYLKSKTTNNMAKVFKPFGDGRIMVPAYLIAILIGELEKDTNAGSVLGHWGQHCCRTILVGAPPVLLLQVALGASRPEDGNGSHWHAFKDNNGVSGHSFMGSVPFLTAAKMTDHRFVKFSFYAASTLTGLSRINDNKHYFSQAILGWWMGYLAVNSVKNNSQKKIMLQPALDYNGIHFTIFF